MPSVSASSQLTYRLRNRQNLVAEDWVFLRSIVAQENISSLIVQDLEEGIMDGEYSLISIDGEHTYTILKRPSTSDFRVGSKYGGIFSKEKKFDGLTQRKAGVERRIAYARIDGIVRKDGVFVLTQMELIQPQLWLETLTSARGLERYCQAVFGS